MYCINVVLPLPKNPDRIVTGHGGGGDDDGDDCVGGLGLRGGGFTWSSPLLRRQAPWTVFQRHTF